ncbi:tetratricopeptide repeat protein [Dyella terrae]|uniref:tetratricopeptide repeat protein n=1 Tax=Dyella terrae TaxID=522259 RepID=UPI001F0EB8FA|nr:tetratricopeptide repeat protein [Dyella terrae]
MPILFYLSIAMQVACIVHVIRTNRPFYWIVFLVIGSYLTILVYTIVAIIPDLRHDPRGRQVARKAVAVIDPQRRRRELQRQIQLSNTVENRRRLADECLQSGDCANALELFDGLLAGMYATDPDFMLGKAQAQAGLNDFAGARQTLDALIAANPNYRSTDGHLLYARSLEALGETDKALDEYRVLADSYPGEEGRFRYAALLARTQRITEAREVLNGLLDRARLMPGYYRRKEKEWLAAARSELARLP